MKHFFKKNILFSFLIQGPGKLSVDQPAGRFTAKSQTIKEHTHGTATNFEELTVSYMQLPDVKM